MKLVLGKKYTPIGRIYLKLYKRGAILKLFDKIPEIETVSTKVYAVISFAYHYRKVSLPTEMSTIVQLY